MTVEPLDLKHIDVVGLDEKTRIAVAADIVPHLLRRIGDAGLTVGVEFGTDALESYHSQRDDGGTLYTLLSSDQRRLQDGGLSLFLLSGGKFVGAVGSTLYWCERSLAESLEAWDATAKVTAREAHEIHAAHVVYSGGGHVQPEYRGRGVYRALFSLLQILILTKWKWSYHFSLIREHTNVHQEWDALHLMSRVYQFHSIAPFVNLGRTATFLVTSSRRETWDQVLNLK